MDTRDAYKDHFLHALNSAAHMDGGVLVAFDAGLGLGDLHDAFVALKGQTPATFKTQPLRALDAFRVALQATRATDAARVALRRLGGATSTAVAGMRALGHLLCEDRSPVLYSAPVVLADAHALMLAHVADRHTLITEHLNPKIAADDDSSALVDATRLRIDLERHDRRTLAGTVPALAPLVRSEVPSWGLRAGIADPKMRFCGLHDADPEAPPAAAVPDGLLVDGEPGGSKDWAAPVFVGLLPVGPRSCSLGAQPMGASVLGVAVVPSADGAADAAHVVPGVAFFCNEDGVPVSASSVLGGSALETLDVLVCEDLVGIAEALRGSFEKQTGADTVLMIT